MKRLLFPALAASLALSSAAAAETPETRPSKADATVETGAARVICRSEKLTGSRLKTKRRCLTAHEWAEKKQFDRLDVDRIQTQRYPHNTDSNGGLISMGGH